MNWKERILKFLFRFFGGIHLKKITNSEYLRSMNDVELANALTDLTYYRASYSSRPTWSDPFRNSYLTKQDAVDCWINWLQETIKE